ncbi:hypothetical protein [Pantoea agglomerans]|uniref:hypothetical protein n=1 Tax=Enterobacter agglomerans TaxID=549 RepID=UPI000F02D18E|nr:hypothetical protein [Pantoea agglomerans]AYP25818.1 hypothetical protein D0A61_23270 [Pantoea agglomerans]
MLVKLLRKDGLAVAVGTVLLYTAAYFFERGYCSRLNIPLDYIEITIPTIANVILNCIFLIMPTALISLLIMQTGKEHEFRGGYALTPLYCGFIFTGALFLFLEHTWRNFFVSAFLGALYFYQLVPSRFKVTDKVGYKVNYFKSLDYLSAAFLVSMTFTLYGHFYAADAKFDIYTQNGHQYELLKVYGENVFMREIQNEKRATEITYFNAQNMTGMKLSQDKTIK